MADSGEVYMEVPAVEKIRDAFGTFADVLGGVSKGMEIAIVLLKVSALFGNIGAFVAAIWLERIKPNVDNMQAKMVELKDDVNGAIKHYQTGDQTGSNKFR